ncbi:hypothetical protein OsI_25491 [Oryza sativa Indica Group]|uniref:Uncharacterized protein n=1 Tax=Oryza sativa subsp. indica TaxID=39946 RepID=B8B4Q5_ORYSI|nr:hypothetical protein OsI_25491 [Oryza sativa Indica Group]
MTGARRHRCRVVMFPFPFRSHIAPMLQFAELLRGRGLAVTVVRTTFNAPDAARHPELTFVPIHERLPDAATDPGTDLVEQMLALNAACEAPFREALRRVESRDEVLPPVEPLRGRDLIRVDGGDAERVREFIARVDNAMRTAAMGVVINTFRAIEKPVLRNIRRHLPRIPAFAIGPMHRLLGAPEEHGLHAPDSGCVAWLHAHSPRSELYVSLGSVARIDREVFDEMALGLAGSGVPFLWVIRPGFVTGIVSDALPLPEPLTAVVDNGMGKPCFGDQTVNARYVTHQWGVGLELGEVFDRDRVAEAVRKLMVGEEGAAMRDKARGLKAKASKSVEDDGASNAAIDRLVRYMVSF